MFLLTLISLIAFCFPPGLAGDVFSSQQIWRNFHDLCRCMAGVTNVTLMGLIKVPLRVAETLMQFAPVYF